MCNIYRTEEENFEKLNETSIFLFTVAFHSTCYECKIVNITGWHFYFKFVFDRDHNMIRYLCGKFFLPNCWFYTVVTLHFMVSLPCHNISHWTLLFVERACYCFSFHVLWFTWFRLKRFSIIKTIYMNISLVLPLFVLISIWINNMKYITKYHIPSTILEQDIFGENY